MKKIADERRKDLQLNIGDLVLVKLQPYRQTSVATRVSNKLSARYFGPFKILKRIGSVTYQLEFPPTTQIHNVFHVSLLKLYKGQHPTEPMTLPSQLINTHPILEPYRVLQARIAIRNNEAGQQVLV